MTLAVNAFGTHFQLDDGLGAYTTLAEAMDINGFGYTRAVIDATNHDSTGGYEEIIASGVKRSREFTVQFNFIPSHATHNMSTGLLGMMINGNRRNYRMVLPTSPVATWQFLAEVIGFEQMAPVDGILRCSFTFKPSGAPTLT